MMTSKEELQVSLQAALAEIERQKTRRAEERHAYENKIQQMRVDADKDDENGTVQCQKQKWQEYCCR